MDVASDEGSENTLPCVFMRGNKMQENDAID